MGYWLTASNPWEDECNNYLRHHRISIVILHFFRGSIWMRCYEMEDSMRTRPLEDTKHRVNQAKEELFLRQDFAYHPVIKQQGLLHQSSCNKPQNDSTKREGHHSNSHSIHQGTIVRLQVVRAGVEEEEHREDRGKRWCQRQRYNRLENPSREWAREPAGTLHQVWSEELDKGIRIRYGIYKLSDHFIFRYPLQPQILEWVARVLNSWRAWKTCKGFADCVEGLLKLISQSTTGAIPLFVDHCIHGLRTGRRAGDVAAGHEWIRTIDLDPECRECISSEPRKQPYTKDFGPLLLARKI